MKYILVSCCLLCFTSSFAQLTHGIDIHGGFGYTHTYSTSDTVNINFGEAANIGAYYFKPINAHSSLSLGMDLMMRRYNASWQMPDNIHGLPVMTYNEKYFSLAMPLIISYYFDLGQSSKLRIDAGGNLELNFSGFSYPMSNQQKFDLPDSIRVSYFSFSDIDPAQLSLLTGIYYVKQLHNGNSLTFGLKGGLGIFEATKIYFRALTRRIDPDNRNNTITYTDEDLNIRSRGTYGMVSIAYQFNFSGRRE